MHTSPRTISLSDNLFEPGEDAEEETGGGGGETGAEEGFEEAEAPSAAFLKLVGNTKEKIDRRKKKPKTIAAAVFSRALAEVDEMLRSGDWGSASARHLVALYDRLHARCYGVEPAELGPSERFNATMAAGNMLKQHFRADVVSMVEYMLWAWDRELERERWRRENGREGGRIGVRLMFGGHLLTDYRLHLARRGRRA